MSERDWRHVNRIAATNEVVGYYASSEFGKRSEKFRCTISEADYRRAVSRAKQVGHSNQTRAQALFDLMHAACGAQDETSTPRHHATKKKSAAQLDREISEVLSGWGVGGGVALTEDRVVKLTDDHINEIYRDAQVRGDTKTAKLAAKAAYAYDKPDEKIAALAAHLAGKKGRRGKSPLRSHATKQDLIGALKGRARVKFSDRSKRPNMDKDQPRWIAFVQGYLGHDVSGEGATKEAAVRAAVADLPANIRRHLETL